MQQLFQVKKAKSLKEYFLHVREQNILILNIPSDLSHAVI